MGKHLNANLAYDLSKLNENELKNDPYIVSKPKSNKAISPFKIILTLVVILALATFFISSQISLNELNGEMAVKSKKLNELSNERTKLYIDLETRTSLSNVEEYAVSELGLQKANNSQVEYVNIPRENKIEFEDKEPGFFEKILNFFQSLAVN